MTDSSHPLDQPTITGPVGRYHAGRKFFGGRFVLKRLLGRGGMGEVWLAQDNELGDERAVKFLPSEVANDPGAVARLRREAAAGRKLSHPRIVRTDDFYASEGEAAVVMEYVAGKTLAEKLAGLEKGFFEPEEVEGWLQDVCGALEYAHQEARFIHRDLKPSNIIVEAATGRAKVMDFGIARRIAETHTMLTGGDRSGTLAYSSPQQLEGERGEPVDDVYSLGATLYELLTGAPPFFRGKIDDQVRTKVPPRMSERREELAEEGMVGGEAGTEIPEAWEQTVARCLAKRREDRPASAGEVWEELQGRGEARRQAEEAAARAKAEAEEQARAEHLRQQEQTRLEAERRAGEAIAQEAARRKQEEVRRAEQERRNTEQARRQMEQALQNEQEAQKARGRGQARLAWAALFLVLGGVVWGMRQLFQNRPAPAMAAAAQTVKSSPVPELPKTPVPPSALEQPNTVIVLSPPPPVLNKVLMKEDRSGAEVGVNGHKAMLPNSRQWVDNKGRQLTATYSRMAGDVVLLTDAAGTTHRVPHANLSDADREWVKQASSAVATQASFSNSSMDQGAVGKVIQVMLPGEVLMKFSFCPPGSFMMGSPKSEAGRGSDEDQVQVRISKGFWMGQYEVTQGQWQALMGSNPSHFKGSADLPVEQVSWEDAQGFIAKLNQSVPLPAGWQYALPTEAQWEYACRAGTETPFNFGSALSGKEANCDGNFPYGTSVKGPHLQKTVKVGSYLPNAWGLYDMHGNVCEWCMDWYDENPAGGMNPGGPISGSNRVRRGGSWFDDAKSCRAAYRDRNSISDWSNGVKGLRIVAIESAANSQLPTGNAQSPLLGATPSSNLPIPTQGSLGQFPQELGIKSVNESKVQIGETKKFKISRGLESTFVRLHDDCWFGTREVTRKEWMEITGKAIVASEWDLPITNVSYLDVCAFIEKIQPFAPIGWRFSLPSKEEWMTVATYSKSANVGTDVSDLLNARAWHSGNSSDKLHPTGQKQANDLGVFDLQGNVWEWTRAPANVRSAFIKGGGFRNSAYMCRPESIDTIEITSKSDDIGFRIALVRN